MRYFIGKPVRLVYTAVAAFGLSGDKADFVPIPAIGTAFYLKALVVVLEVWMSTYVWTM